MFDRVQRIFRFGALFIVCLFGSLAASTFGETVKGEFNENALGMKFRPVSEGVYLSIFETRVRDFSAFVEDGGRQPPSPAFPQSADHPVVNVSWEDAQRFCFWLTAKGRADGSLGEDERYRLPTEAEWMKAANVETPKKGSLSDSRRLHFGWGEEWPPPEDAGNYSPALGIDAFPHTAPVGSFPPNENGFYDLSGNAWEWCFDSFEGVSDIRVLKGSSWRMREPSRLALNRRIGNPSGLRLPTYGFRVALEREPVGGDMGDK